MQSPGKTDEENVLPALIHRGGLRAEIISEGIIEVETSLRNVNKLIEESFMAVNRNLNDQTAAALAYAREQQTVFEELKALVSIPSVSTHPAAKPDMQRAAEWVAGQLSSLGCSRVQIMPTGGHPVVYGELLTAGADKPTVLGLWAL